MADTAGDVRWLASELGIGRLAVWGMSGGGSHALACAALLPDLVAGACVLATFAPYWAEGFDFMEGLPPATLEEVDLFLRDRIGARARFRSDVAAMMPSLVDPERWLAKWGERAGADEAHDRVKAGWLAATCAEALREGDDGWWCDWEATLSPWGFEVEDVRVPVRLWHGERDDAVPVAHGRYLASRLPDVVARFGEDEDHTDVEDDHRDEAYAWMRSLARR
jgi:pimeloyl-ACP methyl ester carboxylesterase